MSFNLDSPPTPHSFLQDVQMQLGVEDLIKMADTRVEEIDFCTLGMFIIGKSHSLF